MSRLSLSPRMLILVALCSIYTCVDVDVSCPCGMVAVRQSAVRNVTYGKYDIMSLSTGVEYSDLYNQLHVTFGLARRVSDSCSKLRI